MAVIQIIMMGSDVTRFLLFVLTYKVYPHLNRDKIESNWSVPGIQGRQENALIESFEMSPHLICR